MVGADCGENDKFSSIQMSTEHSISRNGTVAYTVVIGGHRLIVRDVYGALLVAGHYYGWRSGDSPVSPITIAAETYGPEHNGNSILVRLSPTGVLPERYLYIGGYICQFTMKSHLAKFSSPIGKNSTPYPYARDADGRYYLFEEKVVLEHRPEFVHVDAPVEMDGNLWINEGHLPRNTTATELYLEYSSKGDILAAIKDTPIYFVAGDKDQGPGYCKLGHATIVGDPENPYEYYYDESVAERRINLADIFDPPCPADMQLMARSADQPDSPGYAVSALVGLDPTWIELCLEGSGQVLFHPDGRTIPLTLVRYNYIVTNHLIRLGARRLQMRPIHMPLPGWKVEALNKKMLVNSLPTDPVIEYIAYRKPDQDAFAVLNSAPDETSVEAPAPVAHTLGVVEASLPIIRY